MNLQKIWNLVAVVALVAGGAYIYTGKHKTSVEVSANTAKPAVSRKLAEYPEPTTHVGKLNQIIFSIRTADDVDPAVEDVLDYVKKIKLTKADPEYGAVKIYENVITIAPMTKSLLWRLGGVILKSDYIYGMVIDSLMSFKYNEHLYSSYVGAMFDYVLTPGETNPKLYKRLYPKQWEKNFEGKDGFPKQFKRFTSMSEVQAYALNELIPLLENRLASMEELSESKAEIEFQYDRALLSGGDVFASYNDRYATFVKPYLDRGISFGSASLASLHLFTAYNLDDLTSVMGDAFFKTIKGSSFLQRFTTSSNKRAYIHINTPKDYIMEFLPSYPKFLTLNEKGQKSRSRALALFQKGTDFDLSYRKKMEAFANLADQGRYIVDAAALVVNPLFAVERLKKLQDVFKQTVVVTDPVTGKSAKLNIPAAFAADFNKDLKTYLPTEFAHADKDNFFKVVGTGADKEFTFHYDYGRPIKWNDPTFSGVLPGVTNATIYETNRIMVYNADLDVVAGVVFGFIM